MSRPAGNKPIAAHAHPTPRRQPHKEHPCHWSTRSTRDTAYPPASSARPAPTRSAWSSACHRPPAGTCWSWSPNSSAGSARTCPHPPACSTPRTSRCGTAPTETRLLVLPAPDADLPEVTWCAGGPIGLLDLAATAAQLRACAPRDIDEWHTIVTGTEAARPWWRYLDAHHADPARYPAEQAMAEFEAQPRIAAMATAAADSHGGRFAADMYGPGLEALHTNDPNVYADYQAGLLTFADGLVTLDGQLIIPSFTPVLVEQTLAERQLFHDRAGSHVAALDPP